MSAAPPSFSPQTSFSTLAQQPISSTGLPGSELDGEFARAADSINKIKSRLSEIQRDDGKLRNGAVTTDSLSQEVRGLVISSGTNPVTWATSQQFAVGDLISNPPGETGTYLCITAHTSSSLFVNDLSKWALIATPPTVGVLYTNTFIGNGTTTVFTLTQQPASKDSTQLFIDGIYQPKTGYSLSENSLTITPAPENGSDIEVVIGIPSSNEINITTVTDGAITTAKLEDSAVTTQKIAELAVTGTKLAPSAVTSAKLADLAISTAKLANGAVINAKIAGDAITFDKISDGAVTSSKLSTFSVTGDKLADNAVTTAKIGDGEVTAAKLSPNAIATASITDGSVTSVKIATNAVSSTKIADSAIATAKIADLAVTTAKIANASITAAKLSSAQGGVAPVYGVRAWARVASNGTVTENKGFSSITNPSGSGTYSLTLIDTPTENPCTVVTCHSVSGNNFNYSATVQLNSLSNFTVKTGFEDVDSLSDIGFSIIVIY